MDIRSSIATLLALLVLVQVVLSAPSPRESKDLDLSATDESARDGKMLTNSPIYYIRLPPSPYIYYPGFGYMSNPPPPPTNPFFNLPVNFINNGKPTSIFHWKSPPKYPHHPYTTTTTTTTTTPKPTKKPQSSSITWLNNGPYNFNGKPQGLFIYRSPYRPKYWDKLHKKYHHKQHL